MHTRSISLLLTLTAALASAQEFYNIEPVFTLRTASWGTVQGIAGDERYAYVLDQLAGLRVIDIRRPELPVQTSLLPLGRDPYHLTYSNGYLFIAAGRAGVLVVDVRNPARPDLIGMIEEEGDARSVAIRGSLLVVASGESGIVLFDVGNPQNPQRLSAFDTPGFARRAAIFNDLILVADSESGLRVIDVSDRRNPVGRGSLAPEGDTRDVTVFGPNIYIAETSRMFRIGLNDPTRPERLASYNVESAVKAIAASAFTVAVARVESGEISLLGSQDLRRLGSVEDNSAPSVLFADDLLLAARRKLMLYDASRPESPRVIGSIGRLTYFRSVEVWRNYALFGTAPGGVDAYDITDPARPRLVWSPVNPYYETWQIAVDGDRLISGDGRPAYLRTGQIDLPERIEFLANRYHGASWIPRLRLNDRFAMITSGSGRGGFLFDIANLANPILRAAVLADAGTRDAAIFERTLLLQTDSDVELYDIGDLVEVRRIGSWQGLGRGTMRIVGDEIWINTLSRLRRGDLSQFPGVEWQDEINLSGEPGDMVVVGNHAIVTRGEQGLRIVRKTDRGLRVSGYARPAANMVDVAFRQPVAVVAFDTGFAIYNVNLALQPNIPPRWGVRPGPFEVAAGEPLTFDFVAEDSDADTLSLVRIRQNKSVSARVTRTGPLRWHFAWNVALSDTGRYEARYLLDDGEDFSDTLLIRIDVSPRQAAWPEPGLLPQDNGLSVHPNPFNNAAVIEVSLTGSSPTLLEVFDAIGHKVGDLTPLMNAVPGFQWIEWDAARMPAGRYIVRLTTATGALTAEALLVR